jgi:hypothetical protein
MIAADTSTWIAFLQGERGEDTDLLDQALRDKQVVMVPVVLTGLLSDPKLDSEVGRASRNCRSLRRETAFGCAPARSDQESSVSAVERGWGTR